MEWLATFVVALIIVLVVGTLWVVAGAKRSPASNVAFFVLLLVGTLAIGAWAERVGPQPWGVPVVSLLVGAILLALLIAAATPTHPGSYQHTKELPLEHDTGAEPDSEVRSDVPSGEQPDAVGTATAVGVSFWIFLVVAGTAVLVGLLF